MYAGMGVEPVSIGAAAAKIGSTILSKLIGSPRGEYQKFGREVAPILQQQIARTGEPAFAFWFGEAVGLGPQGEFYTQPVGTLEAYQQYLQEWADASGTGVQSYEFGQFIRYAPSGFIGPPAPGGPMPEQYQQAGFFGGELTAGTAVALLGLGYLALKGFK